MLLGPVRSSVWSAFVPKSWLRSWGGLSDSRHAGSSPPARYWALGAPELLRRLETRPEGLSSAEAACRLAAYGRNTLRAQRRLSRFSMLSRQLQNPLLLLLVFAASASGLSGEWIDAAIVMTIVVATVLIGYSREYSAQSAAAALRARLQAQCTVLRDGQPQQVPTEEVVPGDIVLLSAGSLVPADAVLLEANDFFVNQAVLTGESFPVQKQPGVLPDLPCAAVQRTTCVFLGSNVRSGTARCVV